jgi:hypothetical protein
MCLFIHLLIPVDGMLQSFATLATHPNFEKFIPELIIS